MGRADFLSGRTRVVAILGDPIAQVKSPAGVTNAMFERGRDCVIVPIHVTAGHVAAFIAGASPVMNLDGLIATVPHKFAAYQACATTTPRARLLEAANVLRRNPDGTWHGDMVDGVGFVAAARAAGMRPEGARALLAGAGGAGSAIALALLEAGVESLAIHDADTVRREALIARLAALHPGRVHAGSADPTGIQVVVNATPAGMRAGDPLPFDASRLEAGAFVGDVITVPEVTPLLAAARARGCATVTGVGMFGAVLLEMVEFLLETGPLAQADA
jgi:shikimate dehydrogenase